MGLEEFSKEKENKTTKRDNGNELQSDVDDFSESNIYRIMLEVASEYDNDFTLDDMREYTDGLHPNTIKKHTGKTFNQIKEHLGLSKNSREDITTEEIKEELEDIEPPVTKSKVNECSFSAGTVKNKYGNGSFVDGLINFGIEPTKEQINCRNANLERNNNSGSSYRYCLNQVNSHSNYSKNANAYIYTLDANRLSDGKKFIYVGKIGKGSSLVARIYNHYVKNGSFNGVKKVEVENDIFDVIEINSSESEFNISLRDITSLYQYDLSDSEFEKFVDRAEFRKALEIAIEEDTTNIIGGN